MDSSAPLDEVPDSVDRGSPSDEEQPSASPAPEPAPESPGFGPNLVLFGDPDNGAHLQFTASKAHLLPSTKLRNAAEAMLSDVEEQERKRMRVDEDATLEIPGLESVDLPGAESHLIAPPMPLSEEQMRRKAENRVIHTHVQQSRRWIVNQIDQRRKACELVEQVNSPFQTMKEIWQALHCFHIFHVPTPSVSEKLHCKLIAFCIRLATHGILNFSCCWFFS